MVVEEEVEAVGKGGAVDVLRGPEEDCWGVEDCSPSESESSSQAMVSSGCWAAPLVC